MGYDLRRVETQFLNNDNQDALGSAHGTDCTDSITCDAAAFLTAFPDGEVPAMVHIGKNTATGLFRPFLAANASDTDRGFLFHGIKVRAGVNEVAALLWHGQIIAARVPLGVGQVAPVQASVPFIRLV